MAFISIKNGVIGRDLNGKGYIVKDVYTTKQGETIVTEYAVWTDLKFTENQIVNVSGGYSDKIDDFGDTPKVSRSIRAYKIEPVLDSTPF